MDIRCRLAEDIAREIGARVLPQSCHCGWPLLEKPEQGIPFCWGCVTDRMNAQRGHDLLTKTRLSQKGIVISWPEARVL